MKLKRNERGFKVGEFTDINGDACSIQESSAVDVAAIWLGCDSGNHHFTGGCQARMHVDRKLAKVLVRHLQRFIDTGRL